MDQFVCLHHRHRAFLCEGMCNNVFTRDHKCACMQGVLNLFVSDLSVCCVRVCDCDFLLPYSVRWVQGPVAFQVQAERRISGSANVSPCTQTRRFPPTQTC